MGQQASREALSARQSNVSDDEARHLGKTWGWSMTPEMLGMIRKVIPKGARLLELGSGKGTPLLCKSYQVTSIEHDAKWVGHCEQSHYIHAPIKDKWYDPEYLQHSLSGFYDCILVDGPPAKYGRSGFVKHLPLFGDLADTTIFLDDTNRRTEQEMVRFLQRALAQSHTSSEHRTRSGRRFTMFQPNKEQ